MTDSTEKAILEEVEAFIHGAAEAAQKAWYAARTASEQVAQRSETYRQMTALTAAGLDALTRAAKAATKAAQELAEKLKEDQAAAPDPE